MLDTVEVRELETQLNEKLAAHLRAESNDKEYETIKSISSGTLVPAFFLPDSAAHQARAREVERLSEIQFNGNLRSNQRDGVQEALIKLHSNTGITLNADCGTGKTVMALFLASRIRPLRTIILVDQIDIAEQWEEAVQRFLPDMSIEIWGGKRNPVSSELIANFTIIIAQSLWRVDYVEDPIICDLLIVDEAHCFSAPKFIDSIKNLDFGYSIALTATIDRSDNLEWVFLLSLGSEVVRVKAQAWPAKILEVPLELGTISEKDYRMSWCRRINKMTWKAKCVSCEHFAGFPESCGGYLPLEATVPASVKWGDRINRTTLVKTVAESPAYLKWLFDSLARLKREGRNVLALGEFIDPIKDLYQRMCEQFSSDEIGLFIGKAATKNLDGRKDELTKSVTFCTYGVANKALDVPHKDCAIFLTPRSDIRQAKGRVERVLEDKAYPIIIDPVITDIPSLYGSHWKRRRLYHESGCEVVTAWNFPYK